VFDLDGLTFVVEKDLHTHADPISIDMTWMGFQVTSALPMAGGSCSGGSCSTGEGGACSC